MSASLTLFIYTYVYGLPLDYWFFEVIGHVYAVQCEVESVLDRSKVTKQIYS